MGPRRARLWLSAAAIAGYLPALGAPLRHWFDFAAFYTGGRLVFQPSLLDPLTVVLLQVQQGLPPTPFVSPPFLAIVYAPLTALPYDLAALVQIAVMAAALVAGTLLWAGALGLPRRWALLGALAWGPASASVASGQVDTLALLLSGAAVRLLADGRRPAAGLAIALLAFKPQLTFGAGLGALRDLGRSGVATMLAGGAVLYGLAAAAVGGDLAWPGRWLATMQSYSTADFAANGWQASSPVSLGLRAAIAAGDALVASACVALGIGVAVGVSWWALRHWSPPSAAAKIAMWTAIGLVLSPHLWVYDATLLLPAIGALAAASWRAGWPATDRAFLTLVFAAGAVWPFGGFIGITLVPLVVVAVPLRLGLSGHMAVRGDAAIVTVDSPS